MARSSRRSLALSGRIPGDPPYVNPGSHPAERLRGLGVRSWRTLVMPYVLLDYLMRFVFGKSKIRSTVLHETQVRHLRLG
jgi:hypothetical protein